MTENKCEIAGERREELHPDHDLIVRSVRIALGGEFMVPVRQHYDQHKLMETQCLDPMKREERRKNHEWTSEMRASVSDGKKNVVRVGVVGVAALMGAAFLYYIKALFRGEINP